MRKRLVGGLDDAAIVKHVHEVRHNVVQQPLVVRDDHLRIFLPLRRLTPSATMRSASMSSPESVSSSTANLGLSIAICKISLRFFSPPEKPTFNCLFNFSSSNLGSLDFSFTNFKNSIASSSFSPLAFLIELREVFKNIFVFTPGISNGY